jgi:hypothetical protein
MKGERERERERESKYIFTKYMYIKAKKDVEK